LVRPGRFDRKVYIIRPGLEGREKLFEYYLSKVKHDASVDVGHLARKAVGKTPADIENIIKESALLATRDGKDIVTYKEITEAIERIELGVKSRIKMTDREKEMTAFHEAGHLVTMFLLHPTKDVFKASIIPRKSTLGVVHGQPREEIFSDDRVTYIANIKTSLAGYVAERIKRGVTTEGVSSDFRSAMSTAHVMVWKLGMGPSGYVGDFSAIPEKELSETVKTRLNDDTNKILQQCIAEVDKLLTDEREILDRFAHELLQRQELEYDDIEQIFSEYGKANPRAFEEEKEKKKSAEKSSDGPKKSPDKSSDGPGKTPDKPSKT